MSRGQSSAKSTIQKCTEVLDMYHVSDAEILVSRAEAYILNHEYELALADYQLALKNEDSNRVHDGIKRVEKLIKQSKKRDYYKILGVRRTANKAEILKAYRKHAIKWHPDKYEGEDKKKAEKMFIDIAAAKEVLTDTGLYLTFLIETCEPYICFIKMINVFYCSLIMIIFFFYYTYI